MTREFAFTRLVAIGFTAVLVAIFKDTFWEVSFAIFSAHYSMGTWFAIRRANRSVWLDILSSALLTLLAYCFRFPLILGFGLHHVLNESLRGEAQMRRTRIVGNLCWEIALYLILLRHHPLIAYEWLCFAMIAAGFFLPHISLPRIGFSAFLVGLSLLRPISLIEITLYHAMFWTMWPLWKMQAKRIPFTLMHFALSFAFFTFTAAGGGPIQIPRELLESTFVATAYFHIFLSSAISLRKSFATDRWSANKLCSIPVSSYLEG